MKTEISDLYPYLNEKKRIKKDNSKRNDEFTHCRCCGEYIYNQRSTSDKRYCMDCG